MTKLNSIKASISKVNTVYDDSITNVKDYKTIHEMTAVNQFLNQVNSLYHDIKSFRQYLASLNKEIERELDIMRDDISYTLKNILPIHFKVNQVRNFGDFLLLDSGLSDDLRSIIDKIVYPLKQTTHLFDDLINEVIISLTESARDGNMQLIYKLITIIEFEANEDLKLDLFNNLSFSSIDIKSIDYKNFRSNPRNYKRFFYDKLKDGLNETFDKCITHFNDDQMLVFDNLQWLEDELIFVYHELNPLFPSNWEIFSFIQSTYYSKLNHFTNKIINSDPPAEDLMRILSYDSHYNKFLTDLFKDDRENKSKISKSIIGEDLKESVLEDYMKVIILRNDEWNRNIMNQESKLFTLREFPPDKLFYPQTVEDVDSNNNPILIEIQHDVYVLPDFTTPLEMLKQQADVAADSGYSKILVGVVENWSGCYIQRIRNYQSIIEDEVDRYMTAYTNERFLVQESKTKKFFRFTKKKRLLPPIDVENMTPEELAEISREGLIEYLAALGNTYEINTDRLQDKFLTNYKQKVHSSYHSRIDTSFDDLLTPSTELNAQIIQAITQVIINDVYPALSEVFTKSWYENNQRADEPRMAERVAETLAEYLSEIRGYCTYDFYSVTASILIDAFVTSYIQIGFQNILFGSGKRIDPHPVKKSKSFAESIDRDIKIFYGILSTLLIQKETIALVDSLSAIEFLVDLSTCDNVRVEVPTIWEETILPRFYYCSVEYVRGILLCRQDLDTKVVNAIITDLKERQLQYHQFVEPPIILPGTLNDFEYA